MNKLNNRYLHRVLRNLPKDVRAMLKSTPGLMVGGGFIRAIVSGETPNDIDCFGKSAAQLKICANNLHFLRAQQSESARMHETDNAVSVFCPPRFPVQFITRWTFEQPEDALKSFDFTIAMALVWRDDSETQQEFEEDPFGQIRGWKSAVHDDFYADLAARRLVYTHPERNEDAGGSLMRVRKFLERGYNIQAQSLAGTVARLMIGVDQERVQQHLAASEGLSYERALTKVLTGLLREVDPLLIIDGVDPDDSQPEQE